MKINKYFYILLASAALASCSMEDIVPQSNTLLDEQWENVLANDPLKGEAPFAGMFNQMAKPNGVFKRSSPRADDFGFVALLISNDAEGADYIYPDSNYNWFSSCGEYSSRNPDYANPYIRYAAPYNTIADANGIIKSFTNDPNKVAQAKCLRAYSYMELAPFFQFRYVDAKDLPCVPLVTEEDVDFTNNPRASVEAIYTLIINDLTDAIAFLDSEDAPTRTNKSRIDKNVAYGLRARAYLAMGLYAEAYADAVKAAEGYTPASIEEVSKPAFYNIEDHNWIWGYDMGATIASIEPYATAASWISSFSGNGYAAGAGCYAMINSMLYNKIPDTDVRKGWWVNEDLYSPLLDGLQWDKFEGQAIAGATIPDIKEPFLPYTNVKFGCFEVGTILNEEDFPFMRVEEMILIQAECQAALKHDDEAATILENFVKTYRDPSYSYNGNRNLLDEIWFQRRIELWGEGFFVPDARRLAKPIVRTHGVNTCNQPANFEFNLAADDAWLNMRFSTAETDTNFGIVDNEGGAAPNILQNAELRDGVTD